MVVAASRNHLYRRRLQVVIDAGPRNQLDLFSLESTSFRGLFYFCGQNKHRCQIALYLRVEA